MLEISTGKFRGSHHQAGAAKSARIFLCGTVSVKFAHILAILRGNSGVNHHSNRASCWSSKRSSRAFCQFVTRPFGLLLRSALTSCFLDFRQGFFFLSFWAFIVSKISWKLIRENKTISWQQLDCRLTMYESTFRTLLGTNSIYKWTNCRTSSGVRRLVLYSASCWLEHGNMLQGRGRLKKKLHWTAASYRLHRLQSLKAVRTRWSARN